jgi:small subunit ribosomal protein S3Ae
MAFGKNPKNFSKGRKGVKRRVGDRFLKKEWWTVKSPGMFQNRLFTKTPVNQTAGRVLAQDSIKNRVFEISLGDLNPSAKNSYQKIKLIVDDASEVTNKECQTNFYGLDTTKDHLCSLIRKWHTLIETFVDVKTNDGFVMRFFVVAFTQRAKLQIKATTYAQRSQIKQIRKKMNEIITKEVSKCSLKELVSKLTSETMLSEMTKSCKKIFPIYNCIIRKVKSVKRPRFDMNQLMSMQTEVSQPKVEKAEGEKGDNTENLIKA